MQLLHQQMESNYITMKNFSSEERVKKIIADAEVVKKRIAAKKKGKELS